MKRRKKTEDADVRPQEPEKAPAGKDVPEVPAEAPEAVSDMSVPAPVPEEGPDLEESLESIYMDKKGKLPDFTRLEGKPRSRAFSFILGLVLFLGVLGGVVWGGLWYFGRNGGGFTGDGVSVSIGTEDSLTVGQPAEVRIRYRNDEAIPLASAVLSVDLPEGFVLLEAEPEPDERGEWHVGSVSPGMEDGILLKGWVRSSPEEALTFRSTLSYKPADFSSTFERVGSHTVVVDDTALEVAATGPEKLTPGDEVEYVYTYSSTSTMPLDGLAFRLDAPDGFVFSGSEPAPDEEDGNVWTVPTLEPGVEGTVTVRGTFSSEARGPKRMDGTLGFVDEDGEGFIAAAQGSIETEVLKSALALGLIVNGSAASTNASFGELLNITVTYANEGDVDLKDIELSANLPSEPGELLDWVALDDEADGERDGSTITWTSEEVEAIELLEPGDEGTIDITVPVIKEPLEGVEGTAYAIDATVSAKIGRVGTVARDREVTSAPLVVALNSDTVFRAFARYFTEDGTPLGSGPLPPKVGQPTVYRVFWVVENSLHELTNLSVETVLPQGAKWAGTERLVEAGELVFDETGRKATWRLNRMPTSVDRLTAMFDVEYVPRFEDVGRIADITDDIRFEALDKETQSVILITERPIDTSLPADDEAAGKGTVQE